MSYGSIACMTRTYHEMKWWQFIWQAGLALDASVATSWTELSYIGIKYVEALHNQYSHTKYKNS